MNSERITGCTVLELGENGSLTFRDSVTGAIVSTEA